MRASLAEAASAETERAASIAGARASFASTGAGFAGFGENATETGSGEKNVTASAATAQLAWLKARCLEISGSENWELAAQTVARLALASPDDKSDDAVAAELFDFFGDAGVELIMGAIERRGAMAEALRDANAPGYVSKVMAYGDQLEKLALRDASDNQCPDRPDASKS